MGENAGYEFDQVDLNEKNKKKDNGTVSNSKDTYKADDPKTEAKEKKWTILCGILSVVVIAGFIALILGLVLTNDGEVKDVCEQPIRAGNCDSFVPRWGYVDEKEGCVEFMYGGCEGNENNFMTEDDCQSRCGDAGGLPSTVMQFQDTPLATKDVSSLFETSDLLNQVAPPSARTGNLREKTALPTGHFACNQINHGPLSPMRLFPHSATMSSEGITYDAYTLQRWTALDREDPFYQLTPSKKDEPWVKLGELGAGMKQMVSAPDGTPLAIFSGQSGVQVGIENSKEPVMTDFGEMFADFLFTNGQGGSMEVPLVRASAMLTHLFNNANPVLKPYCLVAVNGQDTSFECPEEESVEDAGSGFIEATCDSSTGILSLLLHLTKPITNIKDVQWTATEMEQWEMAELDTCDESLCDLSSDGLTVTILIPEANNTMNFAVNILNRYVVPQHDYVSYWVPNPGMVLCDMETTVTKGTVMPPWFYGYVSPNGAYDGNGNVVITAYMSNPVGKMSEIQYLVSTPEDWSNQYAWKTCTEDICTLFDYHYAVTITIPMTSDIVNYALNVISQFVIRTEPHNWKTHPLEIRSEEAPTILPPTPVSATSKKFIFELSEPANYSPSTTRKFVAYFDTDMEIHVSSSDVSFTPAESLYPFTGTMQLVYAGAGSKGDFATADWLDQYAGVYPYKPKTRFGVDWENEDDVGYISFDWNKRGGNFFGANEEENLLMVTLPHHERLLDNLIETHFGFKGYVGDRWVMKEPLPRASFEPIPEAVERIKDNPERLQAILDGIEKDANYNTITQDCMQNDAQSYWSGKGISFVARLGSISRAFGTDHYKKLDEDLRYCLDRWLQIIPGQLSLANTFKYDEVWGGMWMRGANEGEEVVPWTNFGFTTYADHHFHIGMWSYAIAYYAKHHMDWVHQGDNYDRIMALARDVVSPSKADPFFPTVRQKDWYIGTSWATGIGGGTRQEESSSEAIMCYHALAALGEVLDDKVLMGTGQITLATEIRAVRDYFHVRPYNRHLFPPMLQKFGVIGQIQEDGIYYYTLNWECEPDQFPQRHACIVGIQVLPIVSVSHLFMDQEWAVSVEDICNWAIDPLTAPNADMVDPTEFNMEPVDSRWQAFCQAILAKVDDTAQARAADYIMSIDTKDLEPGTGIASTLLFIWEDS